jgi:cell division protease FtsH
MLREYIQDKIKVLLGGRAAEEVVYGSSVSSGAFSDLEKAFLLARTMVMEYGMGTKVILPYMSEIYKRRIDDNIHFILVHLYAEAIDYIKNNRPQLDYFVNILMVKKTLVSDEIQEIFKQTI